MWLLGIARPGAVLSKMILVTLNAILPGKAHLSVGRQIIRDANAMRPTPEVEASSYLIRFRIYSLHELKARTCVVSLVGEDLHPSQIGLIGVIGIH